MKLLYERRCFFCKKRINQKIEKRFSEYLHGRFYFLHRKCCAKWIIIRKNINEMS